MRRTAETMGTVVSLDIPGCDNMAVFDGVFNRLREIDNRFSTYKPTSEVSRYRAGELHGKDASQEFMRVKAACLKYEKLTGGYFSAGFEGEFDPTGYVKGWAIAEAGKLIRKAGYGTFCIGIGGDILAASASDKVWNIAIQDPHDKSKILNRLSISNGAVATSGAYERGAHIINPKSGQAATYWASVTVSGPDIIAADVLATACFAMGARATDFMQSQLAYELIAVKN